MSYGVRTWSANGTLQLDTGTFTYQVLHSQTYALAKEQVITVQVPEFRTDNCSAAILPIGAPSGAYANDAMPYMTVSNGSITIRSKNPSEPGRDSVSQLRFRLLVMRYKN